MTNENTQPQLAKKVHKEQTSPPPEPELESVKYAGFWIRALAIIIDGIILGALGGVISIILASAGIEITGRTENIDYSATSSNTPYTISDIIIYIFAILYVTITTGSPLQATLGKKILGLKVIRPDGSKITYLRAFGRFWATMISAIILYIGYIMAAFTKQNKALHDMIADTRVVYSSSL